MEVRKLLNRMNFHNAIDTPSVKLLNDLCIAFVSTIPYETLGIFGGKKRTFDLQVIYEHVVEHQRGGFCIELTTLFYWMLAEIGFEGHMCTAINPMGHESIGEVENHMAILIKLENETYVVDVGWSGTNFVYPLKLSKISEEQSQPNGVYRILRQEGRYAVQKKKQTQIGLDGEIKEPDLANSGVWVTHYYFTTEKKELKDFHFAFTFGLESHPFCTQNAVAVLHDHYRRIVLIGNILIEKQYVDPMRVKLVKKELIKDEELSKVLLEYFNIKLDFELKPRCASSVHDA